MALAAAALFGMNGTVAKVALHDFSAYRLAETRSLGALAVFLAIVLAWRRARDRGDRPRADGVLTQTGLALAGGAAEAHADRAPVPLTGDELDARAIRAEAQNIAFFR